MSTGPGSEDGQVGPPTPRLMALCALAILLALQVVGVVSASVLRHLVQTTPLWIVVGLGLRSSRWTRWAAFPVLAFWRALMTVV